MSTLTKLLIVPAVVVAFGVGVALAASGGGGDVSSPVSATASTADTTTGVLDVSGPCDEAEHRNDPRCTGAAGIHDDDNSGPGSRFDDDDDDNSGPGSASSGRGSHDDDDDRGGHGSDERHGGEDR